jgi:hypothetical protein
LLKEKKNILKLNLESCIQNILIEQEGGYK